MEFDLSSVPIVKKRMLAKSAVSGTNEFTLERSFISAINAGKVSHGIILCAGTNPSAKLTLQKCQWKQK